MAFTGILATDDSQLGSFQLGSDDTGGLAETILRTDALATTQTQSAGPSETLTLSEAGDGIRGVVEPVSDTLTQSDAADTLQAQQLANQETVTRTDALASVQTQSGDGAETVTRTDATDVSQGHQESGPETVTLTEDTLDTLQAQQAPVDETVTRTDVLESVQTQAADGSETISRTDAESISQGHQESGPETVTLTEGTLDTLQAQQAPVDETVTRTDALATVQEQAESPAETVTRTDSMDALQDHAGAVAEAVTRTDATDTLQDHVGAVAEAVTRTDVLTSTQTQSPAVSENLTVSDVATPSVGVPAPVNDSLTLSEARTDLVDFRPGPTETVTRTDELASVQTTSPEVSDDPLAVSDAVFAHSGPATTETFSLTEDPLGLLQFGSLDVSEAPTFTEVFSVVRDTAQALVETITQTETIATLELKYVTNVEDFIIIEEHTALRSPPALALNETLTQNVTLDRPAGFHAVLSEIRSFSEAVSPVKNTQVLVGETHFVVESFDYPQTTQTNVSWAGSEFGQTPYGGASVESAAPTFVSSDPTNNEPSQEVDVPVSFVLGCTIDLDPYSLEVRVNGDLIILAGDWYNQAWGGDIFVEGGSAQVVMDLHPDLPLGLPTTVQISVRNLAGEISNFNYQFFVNGGEIAVGDTLTLSESVDALRTGAIGDTLTLTENFTVVDVSGLTVIENPNPIQDSLDASVGVVAQVAETLNLFEALQASSFIVASVDGRHIRVVFPEQLQLEGVRNAQNFMFEPLDGGVPLTIKEVTPEFGVILSGVDSAKVVPTPKTHGLAGVNTAFGVTTFTDNVGRFLQRGVASGDTVELEGIATFIVDEVLSDSQFTTTLPHTVPGLILDLPYRVSDHPAKATYYVNIPAFGANASFVGDYLKLVNPSRLLDPNNVESARIVEVLNSDTVRVDTPLVVDDAALTWYHKTGVSSVLFETSESTRGNMYRFSMRGLKTKALGLPYSSFTDFIAVSEKPQLTGVSYLPDGTVLLDFNEDMRFDGALASPAEYSFSGPTEVAIHHITALSPRRIAVKTAGFGDGVYTLTVNASGTPKDAAGNPIDPVFNEAVFTASTPILVRSVFTDKGPIAKPAITLQSGTGAQFTTSASSFFGSITSDNVVLPGGAFTPDHVGLLVRLTGSEKNDGLYKATGVVAADKVKLQASFTLPDANSGSVSWELIDPQDGEIADDPADVTVRVNGVQVVPEAVIGLLGQVILPTTPAPTDDVKIDYAWVPNPVVDFRRLNSREFLLNNWTFDAGHRATPSQHQYRYRTSLVYPGQYTPDNISAPLDQPLLRDVHYRAYERAYSALLNDPALLLLNTPNHQIAYAPLSRSISEESVSYSGNTLPENDPVAPWSRKGAGPASVLSGVLTVDDNTTGPFPGGNPLFWQRDVDLSFDHVFAATWRMVIPTITASEGIFTGVAFGWSTDFRAVVLGYLFDGNTRKLGILKRGAGNDPSVTASWIGGLSNGSPTGESAEFDWSILHSYRFFRGRDGVIRLFVDGEIQELLRVTEDELPFLEELNAPFDDLHGVFFGSISRPAKTVSSWDFVRYVVLPTNPEQSEPAIYVSYEGGVLPEDASDPWTPIGYHGYERVSPGRLLLSSTSVTDPATAEEVGFVGGDFRGLTRIEPLLSTSSDVVLDTQFKILSQTHGIAPHAVMVAVDDGDRLVQLSWFPSKGQPKMSYPGRSYPEEASPVAWLPSAGGSYTREMVGRTLRLTDNVGETYYQASDLTGADSDDRILGSLPTWTYEFQAKMLAYRPGVTGYCGMFTQVYDELRHVGLRFVRTTGAAYVTGTGVSSATQWVDSTKNFTALGVVAGDELVVSGANHVITKVSGSTLTVGASLTSGAYSIVRATRKVELHSDFQSLSTPKIYDFEWFDGEEHTYKITKSAAAGTVVMNGFSGSIVHFNPGTGISRFVDLSTALTSLQVGDHIVVRSGPSTGVYPITALINANTVEINGLPVQSTGIVWEAESGRSMVVSLFIDDDLVGSVDYDAFRTEALGVSPYAVFGGGTGFDAVSSTTDWVYFNVWRTGDPAHKYVGLWKGYDDNALTGYYLPTKAQGVAVATSLNPTAALLTDSTANFTMASVGIGDHLIVDDGPNKGVYDVYAVTATTVEVTPAMAVVPTTVNYRVAKTTDWSTDHRYRVIRDPAGSVAVFFDTASTPAIRVPYNSISLPSSSAGLPSKFQGKIPSVTWGSFDPTNLSQTDWDYIRYGIASSPTEDRIIPPHEVLNQRNVMSSAEHLMGSVSHDHTQYSSSSTGVPYPWTSYVENTLVTAYTRLNEGTPIVPLTQTYEVRRPTPVFKPVSALNNPSDVLNSDRDFLLNDATLTVELLVPNDVLYSSLEIVEKTTGDLDLLEPFTDTGMLSMGPFNFTKDVCLHYTADVLPENDVGSPTPWALASDSSATVSASAVNGLLTFSTQSGQSLYRNDTPLTDPMGLDTEVAFTFKFVTDATTGTGDSGVRVGFSAFGLTAALAFVTTPLGDREVRLLDLNANEVMGSIFFDYLDGAAHTYRLKKNVEAGTVEFSIDGYT